MSIAAATSKKTLVKLNRKTTDAPVSETPVPSVVNKPLTVKQHTIQKLEELGEKVPKNITLNGLKDRYEAKHPDLFSSLRTDVAVNLQTKDTIENFQPELDCYVDSDEDNSSNGSENLMLVIAKLEERIKLLEKQIFSCDGKQIIIKF